MRNSLIKNNYTQEYYGGGIVVAGPTTITGTKIIGNRAEYDAGGFDNAFSGCCVTISNSVISGNGTSHGEAGGLRNQGMMTITNSRIFYNSSGEVGIPYPGGGGIVNSSGASLSLIGVQVFSNASGDGNDGGGIYNGGSLSMSASLVYSNTATPGFGGGLGGGLGGGIYNLASLSLDNGSMVYMNTAETDGGGIYNDGGTVSVSFDSSIHDNVPNDCVGC